MSHYRIINIVDFLDAKIVFYCYATASGAAAAAALDEHRADGRR